MVRYITEMVQDYKVFVYFLQSHSSFGRRKKFEIRLHKLFDKLFMSIVDGNENYSVLVHSCC